MEENLSVRVVEVVIAGFGQQAGRGLRRLRESTRSLLGLDPPRTALCWCFGRFRWGLYGFARQIESRWRGDRLFPDLDVELRFEITIEASHPLIIAKALVVVPFHITLSFGFEDDTMEVLWLQG